MDTVGPVDVDGSTGRNIEPLRAVRRLPKAMGRRILVIVGLDFDDRPADPVEEEPGADQLRRDLLRAELQVHPASASGSRAS